MSGIIVLPNEVGRTCTIWLSPYSRLLGNSTVEWRTINCKCGFDSRPGYKKHHQKQKMKVTDDVSLVLLTRPLEIFCQRGQSRPYNPRSAHRQGALFLVLGVENENRKNQYFGDNRI